MSTFAPIAVIGAGAIFPGSLDFPGFWKNILDKKDLVTDVPATHWRHEDYYDPNPKAPDKTYAKRGAFLPDVPFDAMGFGVPPSILPATDTSQLIALIVAKMVLDDIGRSGEDLSRTSVILGVTGAQELLGSLVSRLQRPVWERSLRQLGWEESEVQAACAKMSEHYVQWQESSFPGLLGNVVAGRIANRLDVGMTNCVTDAACASALTAVHMAILELHAGHSDMVITGGVDTMNDIFMYMCFSKTPALSPTGDCRPFDSTGDGTLLGEGIGMVALKRLADAERDGDKIYAVIRGMGSSSDGRAKSVYAPVSEGQARAVRQAYGQAGYGPETVELMEAHGTATKAGDAAELKGMQLVFQPSETDKQWCALGSIKSQIGHTKAAAGIAGLLKVIGALQHKTLPPTIKVSQPTPSVDWKNSAFYVNTEPRPWVRDHAHPRRAGVSSFGFGGSNFHATLEEYCGEGVRAARMDPWTSELVVIGADSTEALIAKLGAAKGSSVEALAVVGQTDGSARKPVRIALVVDNDLDAKLDRAIDVVRSGKDSAKGDVFFSPVSAAGPVAFLFPGQGSQSLDMGASLHRFAPVADALDSAETVVPGLARVLFPIPVFAEGERDAQAATLTRTEWAQPALGAVSVGMARLLALCGLTPNMAGGHSFGELTALHLAGVMDFDALLRAARTRGELMAAAASSPGAMAAVMGPSSAVASHLGQEVVLANLNAPEQTVIAGATHAVEAAMARLDAAGMRCTRLPVATAFHSPIVAAAGDKLAAYLQGQALGKPNFPVYSNTTAAPHVGDIALTLGEHLRSPVRWVEEIEAMYAAGARVFVEVGPGSVLSGLVSRILKGKPHVAVSLEAKGKDGLTSLLAALGRLVSIGLDLDLAPLAQGRNPGPTRFVAKPGSVMINGANYGKPWPRPDTADVPPNLVGKRPFAATPEAAPTAVAAASAPPPVRPIVAVPAVMAQPVISPPVATRSAPIPSTPAPFPGSRATPVSPRPEASLSQPNPAAQSASASWILAFTESQRQLAEAHSRFGQAMADSHMAFLRSQEFASQAMVAMATGSTLPVGMAIPRPVQAQSYVAPSYAPAPNYPAPAYATPIPVPATPVYAAPPAHVAPPVQTSAAAPVQKPITKPAPAAAALDLPALLLAVVGEKTGYPPEMLRLDMNLEADLGIDSIKRVEILSAVREKAPQLPEPDAESLGKLHTLGQIVELLGASLPDGGTPFATVATRAASPALDLPALLLAVVGEKTGYPPEMLRLDMNLEADLGIDSIKRVEILSAVREKAPELPEPDAETLGKLHTLGQIVEVLGAALPKSTPISVATLGQAEPVATLAAPAGKLPTTELDLPALLLAVVGEKTGYPPEMLRLDMNLEADLGIDSIKRVEILSAVRERAPELPEPDAETLGKLHTLGQIVEVLRPFVPAPPMRGGANSPRSESGASTTVLNPAVALPALTPSSGPALARMDVALVPVPQGQPRQLPALTVCGISEAASGLAAALMAAGIDAVVGNPVADRGVVFVAPLGDGSTVREAFLAAKTARLDAGGAFIVVTQLGGDFGLAGHDSVELTGLYGLAKTVALEHPEAIVHAVDTSPDTSWAQVVSALTHACPVELGLRGSARTTLASIQIPQPHYRPALGPDDLIVVSGGARGVTAACVIELAAQTQAKFALLGRSRIDEAESAEIAGAHHESELMKLLAPTAKGPAALKKTVGAILAAREARATVHAVQAAGGQAVYVVCDVANAESVATALHQVRTTVGPITGIVHGAGVIHDRRVKDKTVEQWDAVWSTKIAGVKALLAATANDALRVLCFFSSVAARTGNFGQADYAASNEVLNRLAALEQKRRPAAVVKSIGWGPWEGGMVTPSLAKAFHSRGIALIPLIDGAKAFVDELGAPGATEVVIGGLLAGDASAPSLRRVNRRDYPFLADHSVGDSPVVPVVLALEWFAQRARELAPGKFVQEVCDVRVLKGITCRDYDGAGDVLAIHSVAGPAGESTFELRSSGGMLHYRATVRMGDTPPVSPAVPLEVSLDLYPHSPGVIYDRLLFHGPDFQVIRSVRGLSTEAAEAELTSIADAGWPTDGWMTDMAAGDGGLQLAVLWSRQRLGAASLPTAIASYRPYGRPGPGPVRGVLRGRRSEGKRSLSDVSLIDAGGRVYADLQGVELHALPGGEYPGKSGV